MDRSFKITKKRKMNNKSWDDNSVNKTGNKWLNKTHDNCKGQTWCNTWLKQYWYNFNIYKLHHKDEWMSQQN